MLSAILLLALQTTGETAVAVLPDDPETWVVEYPRIIEDDVDAYYGCLRSRNVSVGNEDGGVFEVQHRAHVPMCAQQLEKSVNSAVALLEGRKHYEAFTPQKIAAVFKTLEYIHISRGRDLDDRLRLHLSEHSTYDAAYQQTPEQVSGGEQIEADLPPATQAASKATSQDASHAEN